MLIRRLGGLSFSKKLGLAFLTINFLMVGIGLVNYYGMKKTSDFLLDLGENGLPKALALGDVRPRNSCLARLWLPGMP